MTPITNVTSMTPITNATSMTPITTAISVTSTVLVLLPVFPHLHNNVFAHGTVTN